MIKVECRKARVDTKGESRNDTGLTGGLTTDRRVLIGFGDSESSECT